MLEANNLMLILEVFHVSDLENTEEYAELLLFKRKNNSNICKLFSESLSAFSVAGLVKDKGLY